MVPYRRVRLSPEQARGAASAFLETIRLRRTVREFAETEMRPHVMEWDEAQHFPQELLPKLAALGLMHSYRFTPGDTAVALAPPVMPRTSGLASGLPVIGTTTGGSRELFRDRDNSLTYTAGQPDELAERMLGLGPDRQRDAGRHEVEDDDGRVWECDPTGEERAKVLPALGVFRHEAAAVDPVNEHVFLTEDDGSPFFWLADTAWSIVWKGVPDDWATSASNRPIAIPRQVLTRRV